MDRTQLTKNFKLKEFFASTTAMRKGIYNYPSDSHEALDVTLNVCALAVSCLQPIRNHFKDNPIIISSGYRTLELNNEIGGVKDSDHLTGAAVDFRFAGNINYRVVFEFIIKNLEFDQLIWEFGNQQTPNWVHISFKRNGTNRKQVLMAYKDAKKTKYKPYA